MLNRCIVLLTGGIASGKSAVSNVFSDNGVPVIDADVVARAVVRPGTTGLQRIVQLFGEKVLNPDGTLNRKALRAQAFADQARLSQLNNALHPLIRENMANQMAQVEKGVVLLVVPLFTRRDQFVVHRVLVVDVAEPVQLERICRRDQSSEVQAKKIVSSQIDRKARLGLADDVIVNNGTMESLIAHANAALNLYRQMV